MNELIRRNKKEIILTIVIVILISIIFTINQLSGYELVISPTKERIHSDVYRIEDFHDNKILYTNKDGLCLFNLDDKSKTTIDFMGQDGEIYGDYVVWSDGQAYVNIKCYKISTGKTSIIKENLLQIDSYVSIYEEKIVWADGREYPDEDFSDIYIYDLSDNSEQKIITDRSSKGYLDNNQNYIVYGNNKNEDWDVYIYDISTYSEQLISSEKGDQGKPKIFEDKIIWLDERDLYPDIYFYDINRGEEKKIPDSIGAFNIDIYENYVVWDKSSGSGEGTNIYLYDSSNGKTKIIEDNDNSETPKIWKNKIVWVENNDNIILYTFPTQESNFYLTIIFILIVIILILIIILIRIRLKKRKQANLENKNEDSVEVETLENDTFKYQCPNCSKPFKVSEVKRPITVKCPHCGVKGEIK